MNLGKLPVTRDPPLQQKLAYSMVSLGLEGGVSVKKQNQVKSFYNYKYLHKYLYKFTNIYVGVCTHYTSSVHSRLLSPLQCRSLVYKIASVAPFTGGEEEGNDTPSLCPSLQFLSLSKKNPNP